MELITNMVKEISIEVGDLYGDLHEQFLDRLGDAYSEEMRLLLENKLHAYNQQIERAIEEEQEE